MQVHVKLGDEHKILYGLSFLVLLMVAFWYFAVYERPITNEHDFALGEDVTIAAFGDSLVAGFGAKTTGGFVGVLEEELRINITNLGVSGDTTADGWKRIRQVTKLDPDVVIVSLGGNDFLQRVPKEQAEEQLERIVSEIHRAGASVILLEVPGYYGMHRNIARNYNTGYVSNILSGLLGKDDFMFDAIHPNDSGYERIANKIKPVLLKLTD